MQEQSELASDVKQSRAALEPSPEEARLAKELLLEIEHALGPPNGKHAAHYNEEQGEGPEKKGGENRKIQTTEKIVFSVHLKSSNYWSNHFLMRKQIPRSR